jgi:hypothetical protein
MSRDTCVDSIEARHLLHPFQALGRSQEGLRDHLDRGNVLAVQELLAYPFEQIILQCLRWSVHRACVRRHERKAHAQWHHEMWNLRRHRRRDLSLGVEVIDEAARNAGALAAALEGTEES